MDTPPRLDSELRADAVVLFGATGDLALRMLFPSLYALYVDGFLPESFRIVGVARQASTTEDFRARVAEAIRLRHTGSPVDEVKLETLLQRIDYCRGDATRADGVVELAARLKQLDIHVPMFYLATSPSLYSAICGTLRQAGLSAAPARVVLEKPLGRDLASSQAINRAVGEAFDEDRVFRIDHYLGKETVQNLLALRFANSLFERLWNNLTIDHVQITVTETEGVGDRWPYYDEYGALRDMVQNHILQLLCLVAMEPPADLDPDSVRNEKVKVLKALRPMTPVAAGNASVRGQYGVGLTDGKPTRAYVDERGQDTDTETFVALRAEIDNWRWAGVPFFLRTGKRMAERRTQIVIQLRDVPHSIFGKAGNAGLTANRLVIDLQPDEDISMLLINKKPGLAREGMALRALPLSLGSQPSADTERRRIAYERLLLDVIDNNPTLFVRRDEVEQAWKWVDGVVDAWKQSGLGVKPYAAGGWGPAGAFALIERAGRAWHD
ncbi:MAG: glucose-6-phosphate dehydrogenase [Gammaproteobacteria bacterium]|nr:glucose-6-phosphate dehydrogenase [Gammaproteobacteria bacterium]